MKIKFLLKKTLQIFFPFLLIIFFLISLHIFKKDYQFGHQSIFFYPKEINWLNYYFDLYNQKFKNYFFSSKKGLEKVYIYLPEKNNDKLLDALPSSTKQYVEANLIRDNKIIQEIKLKYKGSNPYNWLFEQKEIRVRFKKKNTIDNRRYFDYRISQSKIINDYAYFKLAEKIINPSYKVRLVELFINNTSKGIHIERGVLNEEFLRRSKLMPVNTYKGEQLRYDDKNLGLENNLFDNAGLWEKLSTFNLIEKTSYSDLENFLEKIRKASSDHNDRKLLLDYGNLNILSKFGAFQILTQTGTKDNYHNQRIILDPWSGLNNIFVHDGTIVDENDNEKLILDFINDDLFEVLITDNEFNLNKYRMVYELINKENIIEKIVNELNLIRDNFYISYERDIGKIQRRYHVLGKNIENIDSIDNLIQLLKSRKKKLNQIFNSVPNTSWEINNNIISIKINDFIPAHKLNFHFKNEIPQYIAYDKNHNKEIDKEDIYFFPNKKGEYEIDTTFFSNRIIKYHSQIKYNKFSKSLNINNTKFNFLIPNKILPYKVYSYNIFNKKKFEIIQKKDISYYPTKFNELLLDNNLNESKIEYLDGKYEIKENKIFKNKVKIAPGTIFSLCENCSIIFKNEIIARGTKIKPIIFKGIENQKWGSLGIIGNKTSGSNLENIIIENGSGSIVDDIYFYASLSINNTNNIKINNLTLKNNHKFDDLMHIVYSNNIEIVNSKFINSYLDSIDIDISKNIILENIEIINSGNDGIDFMESKAFLKNIKIINSKDKGLSVGEGSKVIVENSKINKNFYGIVAKDGSTATIKNTEVIDNKIQLSTYKKNWRYGKSGKIIFEGLILNEINDNIFQKDKNGEIINKTKKSYKNIKNNTIKEYSLN